MSDTDSWLGKVSFVLLTPSTLAFARARLYPTGVWYFWLSRPTGQVWNFTGSHGLATKALRQKPPMLLTKKLRSAVGAEI